MGFWKNVGIELDYLGLSRKELAFKSKVPLSTINKGLERDSDCYAVDAVRIARILGAPLERLLDVAPDGEGKVSAGKEEEAVFFFHKYKKYGQLLSSLDGLSKRQRSLFTELICSLGGRDEQPAVRPAAHCVHEVSAQNYQAGADGGHQ